MLVIVVISVVLGTWNIWQMISQQGADRDSAAKFLSAKARHIEELRAMEYRGVHVANEGQDTIDRYWYESGLESAGYSIQEYEAAVVQGGRTDYFFVPWPDK
jgi:hypothetical protein